MTALAEDTVLARDDQATATRVGDETVILHLGSGMYFGLDPVGSRVWDLLDPPGTPAAICARMETEFDVAPEMLRADVLAFLQSLLDHAIIRPV